MLSAVLLLAPGMSAGVPVEEMSDRELLIDEQRRAQFVRTVSEHKFCASKDDECIGRLESLLFELASQCKGDAPTSSEFCEKLTSLLTE